MENEGWEDLCRLEVGLKKSLMFLCFAEVLPKADSNDIRSEGKIQ